MHQQILLPDTRSQHQQHQRQQHLIHNTSFIFTKTLVYALHEMASITLLSKNQTSSHFLLPVFSNDTLCTRIAVRQSNIERSCTCGCIAKNHSCCFMDLGNSSITCMKVYDKLFYLLRLVLSCKLFI